VSRCFENLDLTLKLLGAGATANVDSARGNLVGIFINAGFGFKTLMVEAEEGNSWIYKNKDHGMSKHS
jgi:hypothetical protein